MKREGCCSRKSEGHLKKQKGAGGEKVHYGASLFQNVIDRHL